MTDVNKPRVMAWAALILAIPATLVALGVLVSNIGTRRVADAERDLKIEDVRGKVTNQEERLRRVEEAIIEQRPLIRAIAKKLRVDFDKNDTAP